MAQPTNYSRNLIKKEPHTGGNDPEIAVKIFIVDPIRSKSFIVPQKQDKYEKWLPQSPGPGPGPSDSLLQTKIGRFWPSDRRVEAKLR